MDPTPDNIAYLYDGSVEGLFTAVFLTYANKEHPLDICPSEHYQPRIGQTTRQIKTDFSLALRVQKGVSKRAGYSVANIIKTAALADDPHTGISIYRFIRYCMDPQNAHFFQQNKKGERSVQQRFTGAGCGPALLKGSAVPAVLDPVVEPVLKLERFVQNERHHILEFLRFEELEGGLWCARATQKPRSCRSSWIGSRIASIRNLSSSTMRTTTSRACTKGSDWHLIKTDSFTPPAPTANELKMQEAWKRFYHTLNIEARYHPELRRQFMPSGFGKISPRSGIWHPPNES